MLLDEPFSALDMGLRASMREAVAELLESAGMTTILVTHDQAEGCPSPTRSPSCGMADFPVGTPRELYFHPSDTMVAQFLGDAILLPARLSRGMADCAIGQVSVAGVDHDSARIMLRPEQIVLEPVSAAEATRQRGRAGRRLWRGEEVGVRWRLLHRLAAVAEHAGRARCCHRRHPAGAAAAIGGGACSGILRQDQDSRQGPYHRLKVGIA